jgi:Spy/CpxP family protein refolding chaperone
MFRALAIFCVTAFVALPSVAQDTVYFSQQIGPGIVGGMPMPLPMPFPADDAIPTVQKALNLTEAQVTGLKALVTQRTEGSKSAFQEFAEKQKTLQAILAQQNPSALDIGNAYLAVLSAQNTLKGLTDKFQTDFRALLTADQRTALQRLQDASGQIEALRMLGILGNDLRAFKLAVPPMGVTGIGVDRSIQIFRRNEAPLP